MMRWHRLTALFGVVLLAYIGLSGLGIQLADMRALVMHAPADDPDMIAMREHIFGTPNFAVVSTGDYDARGLPAGVDLPDALERTAVMTRRIKPDATLRFVEVRRIGDRLVGEASIPSASYAFDLKRNVRLAETAPEEPITRFSLRSWFKAWHQSRYLGHLGTVLNGIAGILLIILMVTGGVHYARILRARGRSGRRSPYWRGGGRWRQLHRWTSFTAAAVIAWIAITGIALSIDNVGAFVGGLVQPPAHGPDAFAGDFSSPLLPEDIPMMARTTLMSFSKAHPGVGIKVFRLRRFAGYPQGVIVADDADTSQFVFNASNGSSMSMTEPGYPKTAFPFGWEWHQRMKRLHRGDYFGMTGRWLDTLGGLALLYLITSGAVMYAQALRKRRGNGRRGVVW